MGIYVDKRILKDGSMRFRFTYIDQDGKRRRIPTSEHPTFNSHEEALAWAKSQDGHREAMKARVAQKIAWKTKYYAFGELLNAYIEWQKDQAPNSWQNNIYHLEQHVFQYFLDEINCNNVNMWPIHFEAFKNHIRTIKSVKGLHNTISYSTSNHIIRTLNTFLRFLKKKGLMDRASFELCEAFPKKLVKKRTWEDVISPEELAAVYKKLSSINVDVAEFFYLCWHTGMRFNEAYGVCLEFLYQGGPPQEMKDELSKFGIECYGYILLESQPANKKRKRRGGAIKRKPLKGKDKISPENSRVIPISDKDCWNILARRYKREKQKWEEGVYGADKKHYLFFDGMEPGAAGEILKQAYRALNLKPRTFHCARHSKATYLIGETKSYFLARAILGHTSDVIHNYVHIYAFLSKKAQQSTQEIDEIA